MAFGDEREVVEVGSASANTISATYATETPAADDLNIAHHFTGHPNSSVDTSGYVANIKLTNPTEDDQAAIYSQLVTGSGDDTVTCSSGSTDEHMLIFCLIGGAFESSPKDLSDDSGRTTADPTTTGVSGGSTAQADEFMTVIWAVRITGGFTDAFERLGTATPTTDLPEYTGGGVGSGVAKRVEAAFGVLTGIGTVGIKRDNINNYIIMIGYVTYKKKVAAANPILMHPGTSGLQGRHFNAELNGGLNG